MANQSTLSTLGETFFQGVGLSRKRRMEQIPGDTVAVLIFFLQSGLKHTDDCSFSLVDRMSLWLPSLCYGCFVQGSSTGCWCHSWALRSSGSWTGNSSSRGKTGRRSRLRLRGATSCSCRAQRLTNKGSAPGGTGGEKGSGQVIWSREFVSRGRS